MKYPLLLLILLFLACNTPQKEFTAQQLIDKALEVSGSAGYQNATVTFTFRDAVYKSERHNGQFLLQRFLPDTLNTQDVLTNDGFTRIQNGEKVALPDSLAFRYMERVNSVHYFNQLPYGLNDPAVQKKSLEPVTIKEKDYYKIEVTFQKNGGGVDFQDVFLYWISKDNFTVDYLAYKFFTNQGGMRFRESYNPRVIEGIRFVDYNNYKPKQHTIDFYKIDSLFDTGGLELLSKIAINDIKVQKK